MSEAGKQWSDGLPELDVQDLPDDIDHVVIASNAEKGNGDVAHLPGEGSTRDSPSFRCTRGRRKGSLRPKSPAVYPRGFRRVCKACLVNADWEDWI